MCSHKPQCPASTASDRMAAHVISGHPEQGWSLLCNGVVLFDDNGLLLPDGCAQAASCPRFAPRERRPLVAISS